jgi:hypothetical protein
MSPDWRRGKEAVPGRHLPPVTAAAGFRFVVSFEMLDEQGHDLHLVFGTAHRAGLEKIKNAMWTVDPVGGVRFRDPRDPDQEVLDFTLDPDLGPLTRALLAELGRGPRTLAVLKDHALTETVYRPPHARTVVQNLLRRGAIDRDPPRGHLTDATPDPARRTQTGRRGAAAGDAFLTAVRRPSPSLRWPRWFGAANSPHVRNGERRQSEQTRRKSEMT